MQNTRLLELMRVSNVEFAWGSETDGFAQFREPSGLLIDKRISCLTLRKQKKDKKENKFGWETQ